MNQIQKKLILSTIIPSLAACSIAGSPGEATRTVLDTDEFQKYELTLGKTDASNAIDGETHAMGKLAKVGDPYYNPPSQTFPGISFFENCGPDPRFVSSLELKGDEPIDLEVDPDNLEFLLGRLQDMGISVMEAIDSMAGMAELQPRAHIARVCQPEGSERLIGYIQESYNKNWYELGRDSFYQEGSARLQLILRKQRTFDDIAAEFPKEARESGILEAFIRRDEISNEFVQYTSDEAELILNAESDGRVGFQLFIDKSPSDPWSKIMPKPLSGDVTIISESIASNVDTSRSDPIEPIIEIHVPDIEKVELHEDTYTDIVPVPSMDLEKHTNDPIEDEVDGVVERPQEKAPEIDVPKKPRKSPGFSWSVAEFEKNRPLRWSHVKQACESFGDVTYLSPINMKTVGMEGESAGAKRANRKMKKEEPRSTYTLLLCLDDTKSSKLNIGVDFFAAICTQPLSLCEGEENLKVWYRFHPDTRLLKRTTKNNSSFLALDGIVRKPLPLKDVAPPELKVIMGIGYAKLSPYDHELVFDGHNRIVMRDEVNPRNVSCFIGNDEEVTFRQASFENGRMTIAWPGVPVLGQAIAHLVSVQESIIDERTKITQPEYGCATVSNSEPRKLRVTQNY